MLDDDDYDDDEHLFVLDDDDDDDEDLLVLALPLNLTLESPPAGSVPACSKVLSFFQKKIFAVFDICSN